jgi:hypothetical protein
MTTQFHVNGTYEVECAHGKKVEEFYVDECVTANSEAQAIAQVARHSMYGQQYQRFIWTRLHVERLKT